MNPFAGTWNANLTKSQRHANHQFHSASLRFEISDEEVLLTHSGVNAKGETESGTQKLIPDGEERPVSQAAPGIMLLTEWTSPLMLTTIGKKDGNVIGKGTYEVSANGLELTAKVFGTDASGAAFEQTIVFDRA